MTTTPPEAPPPPHDPGPDTGPRVTREEVRDLGRLRRSITDRKVAGVAGGLGRHLDIDPLVLRVAFVVLVFFGGAGLILYGACWLLVPEEASTRARINLDDRTRSVALIIVGVIAALALVGDSWGAFWFPWPLAVVALVTLWLLTRNNPPRPQAAPPGAVPPGTSGAYAPPTYAAPAQPTAPYAAAPYTASTAYVPPIAYVPPPPRVPNPRKRGPILFWFTLALLALAEGVLGMVDLAGADVAGSAYPALAVGICGAMLLLGAFYGRAGGIIALGLIATVGLTAATAADRIDGDSVTETPLSAAAVDPSYSLDAGEQRIDLSQVGDLAALNGRTIEIDGDIGSIDVTLPPGLRALVDARVGGPGSIKLFGGELGGWGIEDHYVVGDTTAPTITLDIELGVGTIEVTH